MQFTGRNIQKLLILVRSDMVRFNRRESFFEFIKLTFFHMGFRSVLLIRIIIFLQRRNQILAKLCKNNLLRNYGIDFSIGCNVGKGLRIEHPIGIVLGKGVTIGDNCTIGQGVTIGEKYQDIRSDGIYPKIGNSVVIGAGSIIVGTIQISDYVVIGAGSIVLADVEEQKTVYGLWK